MKKKDKGNKKLAAMSAVVAAGLTPGVITGAPVALPQPDAGITAADMVSIGGIAYGFDQIYAMQQREPNPGEPQIAVRYAPPRPPQNATYYGVPRPKPPVQTPVTPSELGAIQESLLNYCAQLIDADAYGILISLDSDLTRDLEMTADELKELAAELERRYDVQLFDYRLFEYGPLNTLRFISEYIYDIKKPSAGTIQWNLMDYCARLIDAYNRGIVISPDSDLTRQLGMTEDELKELAAEIKDRYGVEVSYHRFYLVGQLNTLRLVTEYIYKIKHLWD